MEQMTSMTQVSPKERDVMIGQIVAASTSLLEVKRELLSRYDNSNPRLVSAVAKSMTAYQEVNALLRSLGYLLEEPDNEVG